LKVLTQCDSRWNSFGLDPKGNPTHDDNQPRGNVGVKQMIAQSSLEVENDRQAGEVS
jgi:hypothetical protein